MPFTSKTVKDVDAFLSLARDRFDLARSVDADDRTDAEDDVRFAAGDQWLPQDVEARTKAKRPVQTWNRLQTFAAQVVNDGRQNKPAIKVSVMDGGRKETAEFFQGRIRHIEYESDADIAYDTAREHQVTSGRGFFRVVTEYEAKKFDQRLRIRRIDDQFSVLFDPAAAEYDRSDADWAFVVQSMSKDQFERKYGKETQASLSAFYSTGTNPAPAWINVGKTGQEIQVAEYWVKEYRLRTLCMLMNGESKWKDELPPDAVLKLGEDGEPVTRECHDVVVMQYVINGVEILSETKWIGSYIPIIPVWGKELTVNGRRRTYSLIRFAKDPQRLVNLYVSNIAEQIAQMPKSPYIGPYEAFRNFEDVWKQSNTNAFAFIPYNGFGPDGKPIDRPSRIVNEPPIQALSVGLSQAIDGIKAAMGIYDASLGNRSNETSGIAIQRRQREADNANFHFHDNEARSRRHLGRILLELIPKVDKGEKTVPVRSEDGKTRTVKVNTPEPYRDEETGESVQHVLAEGNYDVAISTGPSYTSQRQEAFDTYSQIAGADPRFMQVAGDILFRNLDAPGSDQIAERYAKVLPPGLQASTQNKEIPPEVQQMMEAGKQTIMQLSGKVHQLQDALDAKAPELQLRREIAEMEHDAKIRQIEAQIAIAEFNGGLKSSIEELRMQLDALKHSLEFSAAREDATVAQQTPPEPSPGPEETQVQQ